MQSNIFLFYGTNSDKLNKEIQKWINAFDTKYPGGLNLTIIKEDKFDVPQIISDTRTPPFLGDKRLIILYNFYSNAEDKEYAHVMKSIKAIAETTILVFVEEKPIKSNAKIISDIKKLNGTIKHFEVLVSELEKDFVSIIAREGKTIERGLLSELIMALEKNPFKVANEAQKLALYSQNSTITKSDITEIVRFNTTMTIFEMMDNLSQKNIKRSLYDLSNLFESGEDLTRIFYMIARQIKLIIQIKDLSDRNINAYGIAEKTGLNPFVISKVIPQTKKFDQKKLFGLLNHLLKIDIKIKTGQIKTSKNTPYELLTEIERFLIKCAG